MSPLRVETEREDEIVVPAVNDEDSHSSESTRSSLAPKKVVREELEDITDRFVAACKCQHFLSGLLKMVERARSISH